MASDPAQYRALHAAKLEVVHKLTELNSRHLKSEGYLAGIDFEITRCREALERGDTSEDFSTDIDRLKCEYLEIEKTRHDIDLERESLGEELQDIDKQLAALD